MGTLQVSEGKWTIVFISSDRPSIKELEYLYLSKTVRAFGYYTGFSDVTNQPCIFVDKVVCDGKEYTYDLSDSEEERVPLKRVLKKLNNDDNDEINKEFTVSEKT